MNCVLKRDPGLGIQLVEVVNDGLGSGIVVVGNIAPDSPAANSILAQGDALIAVGSPGGPFRRVEALTFDDVFEALSLVETEEVEIVAKRLVKRP